MTQCAAVDVACLMTLNGQVVDAFERLPSKEQRDEPVSTKLNTYEIIARARYGLNHSALTLPSQDMP